MVRNGPSNHRRSWLRAPVVGGAMVVAIGLAPAAFACSDDPPVAAAGASATEAGAQVQNARQWSALAEGELITEAPTGAFENVEFIGQLPEAVGATAINFIKYGSKDVMFVTGRFGLKSYDVTNPEQPFLLDSLDMPGFWENEDMDIDPNRKLVFMARDPRAFGQNQQTGESGVYIVDAKFPARLEVLSYTEVPAGHTTTCINSCQYLWTGGPRPADWQPDDWAGRPVFVTDIRNPRKPVNLAEPVDLGRNDGVTDYAHDVQVDAEGVAWVSGAGGVRGYWTKGRHFDPVEQKYRVASAQRPVPYGGGKFYQSNQDNWGGSFAHNMERSTTALGDYPAGQVAFVTIENFTSKCETDGRLAIVDLGDSTGGQSWSSTAEDPYRLNVLAEWTPDGQPGSLPNTGCSAHYFQIRDNVLVQSFYGNGTHFLDISDPTNPTQIGYYRPDGSVHWAPYWHGDVMFVADHRRGVDIIRPTYAQAG